jgi:hypothetical protein
VPAPDLGPHAAYGDLTGDGQEEAVLVLRTTWRPVHLSEPSTSETRLLLVAVRGDTLVSFGAPLAGPAEVVDVTISDGVATVRRRLGQDEYSSSHRRHR